MECNCILQKNGVKIVYSNSINEKFAKYPLQNLLIPHPDVKIKTKPI